MSEYLEDHIKLTVIRKVVKENPHEILNWILKTVDRIYEEQFGVLIPPKKKAFVTKF